MEDRFDVRRDRYDKLDKMYRKLDKRYDELDVRYKHLKEKYREVKRERDNLKKNIELSDTLEDDMRTSFKEWFADIGIAEQVHNIIDSVEIGQFTPEVSKRKLGACLKMLYNGIALHATTYEILEYLKNLRNEIKSTFEKHFTLDEYYDYLKKNDIHFND